MRPFNIPALSFLDPAQSTEEPQAGSPEVRAKKASLAHAFHTKLSPANRGQIHARHSLDLSGMETSPKGDSSGRWRGRTVSPRGMVSESSLTSSLAWVKALTRSQLRVLSEEQLASISTVAFAELVTEHFEDDNMPKIQALDGARLVCLDKQRLQLALPRLTMQQLDEAYEAVGDARRAIIVEYLSDDQRRKWLGQLTRPASSRFERRLTKAGDNKIRLAFHSYWKQDESKLTAAWKRMQERDDLRKTLFKELDGCHLMHLAPCLDVAEVINACGDRSPLRIDEKVKLMERIDRSVLAALEDQFFALSEEHAKSIPIACLLAPIGKRGSMARGGAEFVRHFVDGGVLNCKGVGDCAKASVEVEAVCYALNELQWKDVLCSMRTSGIDDLRALRYLQPEYETRVHALMSADEYRSLRKRGGTSRKMEEDWRAQQVIACHHHMLERVDALEAKIDQLERLLKRTVGSSE